jgi:ABC-type transport system involved in multi-copper enzyme maturation permease subunit
MSSTASIESPSAALATTRMYLRQWSRSRAPVGLCALVIAYCWYDSVAMRQVTNGWPLFASVAGWSAFLVGYDTYERLRLDGSLRLILLHGNRRAQIASGFATAGVLVSAAVTLIALLYVVGAGRVSPGPELARSIPCTLLAIAGFIIYAQLLSLVLPRDTAAVLGVMVLVFGSRTGDGWLSANTPEILRQIVLALWAAIPTTARLGREIAGESVLHDIVVQVAQAVVAFTMVTRLLSRRALLVRRPEEVV